MLIIYPHWSLRMTPHRPAPWKSPSWSSPGAPPLWNVINICQHFSLLLCKGPDLEWTVCCVGLAGMSKGWDPASNQNSVFVKMDQWEQSWHTQPWSVIVTCVKCPTTLLVSGGIISISSEFLHAHDDWWHAHLDITPVSTASCSVFASVRPSPSASGRVNLQYFQTAPP